MSGSLSRVRRPRSPRTVAFEQFLRATPKWLVAILVVLVGGGAAFGAVLGTVPAVENARAFLQGLVGMQASLIGIVFAVTILGIQLVASRYSIRMAFLFYTHPVFVLTFLAFVGSIGLDLALLFGLREMPSWWYAGAFYAAIGLAVANGFLFFEFVRTALTLSAPERILDAFDEWLSPGLYVAEVRSAAGTAGSHHPIFPLYRMVTRSLQDRDPETAGAALDQYCEVVDATLRRCRNQDLFEACSSAELSALFDPVLADHLPGVVRKACQVGEFEIARTAIAQQYELGKAGLGEEYGLLAERAVHGLADLGTGESEQLCRRAVQEEIWGRLGTLLVKAARRGHPRQFHHLLVFVSQVRTNHWQGVDPNVRRDVSVQYVEHLCVAHRELLDALDDDRASSIDWDREFADGEPEPVAASLLACRQELCELTARLVAEEGDDNPVIVGEFVGYWRDLCTETVRNGPDGYARVTCRALVELAYLVPLEFETDDGRWLDCLRHVADADDRDLVADTVERIVSRDRLGDDATRSPFDADDRYRNLVRVPGYDPLNEHAAFPGRLTDLQGDLLES